MPVRCLLIATLGLLLPLAAGAAVNGPELSISNKGEVHIMGVELRDKNALNLFSVTVWGQKWIIPIDQFTALESADGKKIQLEEILLGHVLEIKGRADGQKPGWLDARLVRDLSIGSPSQLSEGKLGGQAPPPATSQQAAAGGATILPSPPAPHQLPAPTPPLPPATTPRIQGERLTQQLKAGMRGGEVIILQEFLQKGGWGIPDDGPVTGYYGTVTVNAVKKFQVANGLEPVGEVGPKTRALINQIIGR